MRSIIRINLAVLLLSLVSLAATPTVVQKSAVAATTTGTSVSTASVTTHTGNSLAVACGSQLQTATYTASDGTNTFTPVGAANTSSAAEGSLRWFVAQNITGVTHAITCTEASNNFREIFFYEISGASTSAAVDVPTSGGTSGTTGTSATPSFTLPATNFANDLLLFTVACGNSCSADAGADAGNSQSDANGDESETYSKTATGTYTGQFTQTNGAFVIVGVALTDGGGAGGSSAVPKRGEVF